jgi:hypothetical protein
MIVTESGATAGPPDDGRPCVPVGADREAGVRSPRPCWVLAVCHKTVLPIIAGLDTRCGMQVPPNPGVRSCCLLVIHRCNPAAEWARHLALTGAFLPDSRTVSPPQTMVLAKYTPDFNR